MVRIYVERSWTFRQAVEAAWEAYQGGQQYGVPNRLKVLEQWANVVGRERALAEINDFIGNDIEAAAESIAFSTYALRKLRKSFALAPSSEPTPTAEPVDLHDVLLAAASREFDNELTFLVWVLPRLAKVLGYAESELFVNPRLAADSTYRPDAILGASPSDPPCVLVEIAVPRKEALSRWREQAIKGRALWRARSALVLTPRQLLCITDDGEIDIHFESLQIPDLTQICSILKRPFSLPLMQQRPGLREAVSSSLTRFLDDVKFTAQTNDEKKRALESCAAMLVSMLVGWRCRFSNLRTRSSEIDLVLEVRRDSYCGDLGRYALVECKNWAVPVGANTLRDFIVKIEHAKCKLGLLFSRTGITGEAHGVDAYLEIRRAWSEKEIAILVIARTDLESLLDGSDFDNLLRDRLEELRFDVHAV